MENKIKFNNFLSRSYVFYFLMFFVGIFFDLLFPTHFFENSYALPIGFSFIVFSTLIIFWIKISPKKIKKEILTKEDFMQGPYKYTSIPNHWGIFLLMLGFGIMINAVFMVVLCTFIFIFTLPFFLKMQETVLLEKYGDPYREYRKVVKL